MDKPRKRVKALSRKTAHIVDITPRLMREQYRAATIERLEYALQEAKEGRLLSVAIVSIRPDSSITTAWGGLENAPLMIGGIEWLKHRINEAISK